MPEPLQWKHIGDEWRLDGELIRVCVSIDADGDFAWEIVGVDGNVGAWGSDAELVEARACALREAIAQLKVLIERLAQVEGSHA